MTRAITVRGPFTGPSGYDHHVREFVRALSQRGIAVQLVGLTDWGPAQLPYEYRDPWFESLTAPVDSRSVVHFSFPEQVRPEPGKIAINFTMFEATRIPAHWVAAHVLSDLIVLPTEHSRRAWIESGVPESKLRLCPLGVRGDLYRPGVKPLDMSTDSGQPLLSYARRFLNVSEVGLRKNLGGLLAAWLKATSATDDAVLILKLGAYNAGSLAELEWEKARAQKRARKRFDEAAPVQFIHTLYPDADMPRVFALGTHYVSLSFGEGWDLSMIQAAAMGLRLIAPRHSAYEAYLDDDIASLIPVRERLAQTPAGTWVGALFEGASWWEPDLEAAAEAIRAAIEGRDSPKASARDHVTGRYSWENAAARLNEILDEAKATVAKRSGG